ncbi:MAG TPA: hypothetical protein DEP84_20415 [Chloroflexi bacterium]|nr:hypothetical protein [Chloroflexota bacterium]
MSLRRLREASGGRVLRAPPERRATQFRFDIGRWLKQAAIGGLIAGIVFARFEMVVAAQL